MVSVVYKGNKPPHIISYSDWKLARATHDEFALRPGSLHIATSQALACLAKLLTETTPKKVVEIGGGIGTVTALLLRHPCNVEHITTFEDDPFCLEQLRELKNPRLSVVSKPERLAVVQGADLLVIDGGHGSSHEYGVAHLGTTVWVEGIRKKARGRLQAHLEERGLSIDFQPKVPWRYGSPMMVAHCCWIGTVTLKGETNGTSN